MKIFRDVTRAEYRNMTHLFVNFRDRFCSQYKRKIFLDWIDFFGKMEI